jgi:hypothetical protein
MSEITLRLLSCGEPEQGPDLVEVTLTEEDLTHILRWRQVVRDASVVTLEAYHPKAIWKKADFSTALPTKDGMVIEAEAIHDSEDVATGPTTICVASEYLWFRAPQRNQEFSSVPIAIDTVVERFGPLTPPSEAESDVTVTLRLPDIELFFFAEVTLDVADLQKLLNYQEIVQREGAVVMTLPWTKIQWFKGEFTEGEVTEQSTPLQDLFDQFLTVTANGIAFQAAWPEEPQIMGTVLVLFTDLMDRFRTLGLTLPETLHG